MSDRNCPRGSIRTGMTILACILGLAGLLSGCARTARAHRIGILVDSNTAETVIDTFKAKMTELGHVEGENTTYTMQRMTADAADQPRIAARLVTEKPDLVFAFPGTSALVMKNAAKGTSIPIVFAYAVIVGTDLIDSVRIPGGNITGVRIPGPEIAIKSLESLLELAPRRTRILVIYDPTYFSTIPTLEALRPAASSFNVALQEVHVTPEQDIRAVLQGLEKSGNAGLDAILFLQDWIPRSEEASGSIVKFADAHRMPIAGGPAAFVKEGGAVLSAATNITDQVNVAASIADRILKGTPAGTISVSSTEPHFYINYTKARQLGLTVPQGLLKQATEIYR
jgi:putative tryptophan/tyrosine transport system substrate-binding protein